MTQIEKQFSVSGVNKPGVLANIARGLANEKINIKALIIINSGGQDIMRMVVEKPDLTRTVLKRFDVVVIENNVIAVEIPNRPGAFAGLAEQLNRSHINIECAYCTTGGSAGRAIAVFQVPYLEQARKVMEENTSRKREKLVPNLRAPRSRR
jgi:hypothetical protein